MGVRIAQLQTSPLVMSERTILERQRSGLILAEPGTAYRRKIHCDIMTGSVNVNHAAFLSLRHLSSHPSTVHLQRQSST